MRTWCSTDMANVFFSDFFEIRPSILAKAGLLNVSLVADLPLFMDPFLLFNSKRKVYRDLHEEIIRYLRFLRDRAVPGDQPPGLRKSWYTFSEVRQNWLGYSKTGNSGSALGADFAAALNRSLHTVFQDFGQPGVARGNHLEKLCLISGGVGRDRISDFATNLIKGHLLEVSQVFALRHLSPAQRRSVNVPRVTFNYETETWDGATFTLPWLADDYVILTPRDLLTKDETWINRPDMVDNYEQIAQSMDNDALRAQLDNYIRKQLSRRPTSAEIKAAVSEALREHPAFLEYYIRFKEDHGEQAKALSAEKVLELEERFIGAASTLIDLLQTKTTFYAAPARTLEESRQRVMFLKDVIENQDGWRTFYRNRKPVEREEDLQLLFRLTWFGTTADINREVNNGRGPVDFKASRGLDKSLIEFKLASNKALQRNLEHQVPIYERANDTKASLKVIAYFSLAELRRVEEILRRLKLQGNDRVILIDARSDNKPSASRAGVTPARRR